MFVDELTITAKAGRGGDGVVRWRREKFIPKGGPSGGNGGVGGDVYMRAVRDLGLLSKYTGSKKFNAEDGMAGEKKSKFGKNGEDLYIDVPVGATVIDHDRERTYSFFQEGEVHKILHGGRGGLGNEYFKSSTNRAPEEATEGKEGEAGVFTIELSLIVDAGLIGLPNAGKSTLLNALTHTHARVGAYPFTTLEPSLGELYGFILADVPGLIEGASEGKGLGHKFLKHIKRTKMLTHCVSLENEDPILAYTLIRSELEKFDSELLQKKEWVVLTKTDLVPTSTVHTVIELFHQKGITLVSVLSAHTGEGVKKFGDELLKYLRTTK